MWEALVEISEFLVDLWQTGNSWARRIIVGIIIFVVIPAVIWPFVLLGVSFVDWLQGTWFTPIVALLPLSGIPVLVIILTLAYPLLSGILVTIPQSRRLLGRLFLWLSVLVFTELAIGLYISVFQVWNLPWLIPMLALLVVVLGTWLFLRRQFGWQRAGWFTAMLTMGIVVITIMFLGAGIWRWAYRQVEARGQSIVSRSAPQSREITRIPLLGEDKPSERFLGPGMIPAGWRYEFGYSGPGEPQVHFDDGTIGPITMEFGVKGGVRRFTGSAGQEVVIRAYSPK